jgi:hypothetical protein
MQKRSRVSLWVYVTVIAAVVIAALLIFGRTRATEVAAKRFIHELQSVTPGISKLSDAEHLLASFPAAGVKTGDCREECEFDFTFENTWPRRLRVSSPVVLTIRISVAAGLIRKKVVGYHIDDGPMLMIAEVTDAHQPFQIHMGPTEGKPPSILVEYTSAATSRQQSYHSSLQIGCLGFVSHCTDLRQLSPPIYDAATQEQKAEQEGPDSGVK